MEISFLGATGTVTGSKYLFDDGDAATLIDCGIFQGFKQLRLRNWQPLPIDPRRIRSVVLTHAHIDHMRISAAPREERIQRARLL